MKWYQWLWNPKERVPKNFGHPSHAWKISIFSSIGPTIGHYCKNCGASYTTQGKVFNGKPDEGCDQPCPHPGRAERWGDGA